MSFCKVWFEHIEVNWKFDIVDIFITTNKLSAVSKSLLLTIYTDKPTLVHS